MKTLEDGHAVTDLCAAFDVSRNGYYRWRAGVPSRREREDARLVETMKTIHAESRETYGRPRLVAALRQRGERCSGQRITRLMRAAGLRGVRRKKYRHGTTDSQHGLACSPNRLLALPAPRQPDQVWVTDMTYIRINKERWLYVAAVLDRCSRRVLGLAMGPRLDATLPQTALLQALIRRGGKHRGLIHHSDQGVQYASLRYQDTLKAHGLVSSMSRRANCYDNAHMESFWATLKAELVQRHSFRSLKEASTAIFYYVEAFYNRQRLHSALGYLCPVDFEAQLT